MDINTAKDFIEDLQLEVARLNNEIRVLRTEKEKLQTMLDNRPSAGQGATQMGCSLRGSGCGSTEHQTHKETQP